MSSLLFRPALAGITFVPAAAAAAVDWRSRRIPDLLVVLGSIPPLLVLLLAGDPTLLASVALGTAVMAVPLLLLHLVAPAAMGFGDVKLAAVLGATLGVVDAELAVPALAIASGLTLVAAVWERRSAIAFGPGLVTGSALALGAGAIGGWWSVA